MRKMSKQKILKRKEEVGGKGIDRIFTRRRKEGRQ
jgi:hypothetical protein